MISIVPFSAQMGVEANPKGVSGVTGGNKSQVDQQGERDRGSVPTARAFFVGKR